MKPGQDMALQFACGIEKEESSSISRQFKNRLSEVLCACCSGIGMRLHFNCSVTDCAVKSSQ